MRLNDKMLGGSLMVLALLAGLSAPVLAQASDIDFGDDSSDYANDNECDDPRFTGEGMAEEAPDAEDEGRDATDCRTAFEAGTITLIEAPAEQTAADAPAATVSPSDIDFGDDSSTWALDDICDDMRFTGEGMGEELEPQDVARDATDCRTLFEAGKITLAPPDEGDGEAEPTETTEATDASAIDFGDDTSEYAKDEECDDPRFTGEAMASADSLTDENIGKDATDCQAAFEAGTITLAENQPDSAGISTVSPEILAAIAERIDFGDDSGEYAKDEECDDPDFVGSGMATDLNEINRLGDATDCKAAFIAGTVTLQSAASQPPPFDYGSDYSLYANDGECDDSRFVGAAMAKKLFPEDIMGDATDCRALEQAGEISIKPVYQPAYAMNAPYDSSGIEFGDNSSSYSNNQICDDPRFEGPGLASAVYESDRLADANDCRQAYEAGTIDLREGEE